MKIKYEKTKTDCIISNVSEYLLPKECMKYPAVRLFYCTTKIIKSLKSFNLILGALSI